MHRLPSKMAKEERQSTTTAIGGGLLSPEGLSQGFALLPALGRKEIGSHRRRNDMPARRPLQPRYGIASIHDHRQRRWLPME
jgi:hypothetical protein